MHLVACSSGFWAPRSIEETRDHSYDPPAKNTCFSPLTSSRMHRPQREGSNDSRQLVLIRPATHFFLPSESFLVLSFIFFFFLPSCSRVRPQGCDGPRGDFPGRRGPTEGASHTRLGHEPRPSDLLKISIAFVHRPSRPLS